jgi:dTDP-4-dehydrorhamnose 3,5-epimerase
MRLKLTGFEFEPFKTLPEVLKIQPDTYVDERGWFAETYKKSNFAEHGICYEFVQDSHSKSVVKGVLRGLHYQKEPAAQGKLIQCILGEVFDVAVDIRKGSPTYGRWGSARLYAKKPAMVWIPGGFAHGVLSMTDEADITYKVTSEYSATHDRNIRWNDPAIGIQWPLPNPILSKKDSEAPLLKDADNNFQWKRKA